MYVINTIYLSRGGVRMQLKCRARKRFVDELRVGERYDRYITRAIAVVSDFI